MMVSGFPALCSNVQRKDIDATENAKKKAWKQKQ